MNEIVIGRTSSGGRSFPLSFRVEYLRRWDECVKLVGVRAVVFRGDWPTAARTRLRLVRAVGPVVSQQVF